MPSSKDMPAGDPDGPFASARVARAALRVPDLAASTRWFVEKLDFKVVRAWRSGELGHAWLSPPGDGSLQVEIIGGNAPEPNPEFGTLEETLEYGGYHHVAIDVADLDRALATLRDRGVTALGTAIAITETGRRIAFVADPWGNLVALAETAG